jgi:leukotriene-A4 hydrolase
MMPTEYLPRHVLLIVVFLERLHAYPALPPSHISRLGELYGFSSTQNAEIRLRFYETALIDPSTEQSKAFAVEAAKWVVGADGSGVVKGRMKFCRPIFREVYKVDEKLAVDTFTKSADAFHPIARNLIKKVRILQNVSQSRPMLTVSNRI